MTANCAAPRRNEHWHVFCKLYWEDWEDTLDFDNGVMGMTRWHSSAVKSEVQGNSAYKHKVLLLGNQKLDIRHNASRQTRPLNYTFKLYYHSTSDHPQSDCARMPGRLHSGNLPGIQ